ncbi:FMN-binding negative transcriptional regulator [Aliifodinibius sp. S!AR15-10]|uniref:FMN-binding negative transcriptional regulator n=1 Tax=Aliifodinibius sp. S!AR15-10 TaxID=2950437 RepID=UPI0028660476|nr:FMN-binding negative transcriptional regulator [Aliifodinibius sp. S!AR15-10]MDR8394488.1 FMN-binding negative transcriptional regulator [Aliifodinibius sp. S!AR15-10]
MYIPSSFKETRSEVLQELIQANNFGILISQGDSKPQATHLPFTIDPDRGPNGTLVTHMARANKHWRSMNEHTEALAIFQGAHSYISPSWYEKKASVPTWNYGAVHVYGKPRVIEDRSRLHTIVTELVELHESDQEGGWSMDLVEHKLDSMLKAIVGLEIPIEEIEGKMKFNQNRSDEDRRGVIAHLSSTGKPAKQKVADIMKNHLEEEKGNN